MNAYDIQLTVLRCKTHLDRVSDCIGRAYDGMEPGHLGDGLHDYVERQITMASQFLAACASEFTCLTDQLEDAVTDQQRRKLGTWGPVCRASLQATR